MDENINLEQQKEKITFKWYSVFGYFGIWIISYSLGYLFLFNVLKLDTEKEENKLTLTLCTVTLTIFTHLLDFALAWLQSVEWKKITDKILLQKEAEIQQIIQKQTEYLKKELLETKIELLLTQNKLRELKEPQFFKIFRTLN